MAIGNIVNTLQAATTGTAKGILAAGQSVVSTTAGLVTSQLSHAFSAIPLLPNLIGNVRDAIVNEREKLVEASHATRKSVDDQSEMITKLEGESTDKIVERLDTMIDILHNMGNFSQGERKMKPFIGFKREEARLENSDEVERLREEGPGKRKISDILKTVFAGGFIGSIVGAIMPVVMLAIGASAIWFAITGLEYEDVVEGIRGFGQGIEYLTPVVDGATYAFGILQDAIQSLGRVVGLEIPDAVAGAAAAIGGFFAARGIARRIGYARLGLAGLALGFVDYASEAIREYFNVEADSIEAELIDAGTSILSATAIGYMIAGPWGALAGAITAGLFEIADYIVEHWDEVVEEAEMLINDIGDAINDLLGWVGEQISGLLPTETIRNSLGAVLEGYGVTDTLEQARESGIYDENELNRVEEMLRRLGVDVETQNQEVNRIPSSNNGPVDQELPDFGDLNPNLTRIPDGTRVTFPEFDNPNDPIRAIIREGEIFGFNPSDNTYTIYTTDGTDEIEHVDPFTVAPLSSTTNSLNRSSIDQGIAGGGTPNIITNIGNVDQSTTNISNGSQSGGGMNGTVDSGSGPSLWND